MGEKNRGASLKARELINLTVLLVLFLGYSLTFMIPKFYGTTDRYVGVFVFFCLMILFFTNTDIKELIKRRDKEFIVLILVLFLTFINLLLVDSGLGAFFVAADFSLIFFLSAHLSLTKRTVFTVAACYMGLLLVWFFIFYPKLFADYAYYGYNTNTGATFTIYTLLISCVFVELLRKKELSKREKGKNAVIVTWSGLLMTVLMVKGFQLSLWHRARGAFIMLTVFVFFYYILPEKLWKNKIFYYGIWILATFGSLAFVALYVAVGAMGVNFKLPFFYKEVFSGRDAIWHEFFTLFMKKPLTGIGTNVTIESFFEFNVHNAMYNFLVIDGILVFAGIIFLIFCFAARTYKRMFPREAALLTDGKKADSGFLRLVLVILLSVFFESFFDVDLIWVDYSLNLLFLTALAGCHGEI